MELNIFQDTLAMIQKNFPERKDPPSYAVIR